MNGHAGRGQVRCFICQFNNDMRRWCGRKPQPEGRATHAGLSLSFEAYIAVCEAHVPCITSECPETLAALPG